MARRPAPLRPAILTVDDVWCNAAREECAREAAKWLKLSLNVKRPIDTLRLAELNGMVEHVVAHWIVLASAREPAAELTDKEKDVVAAMI